MEGGPHKIRRTGRDAYEMSVSLPKDQDGRTGRAAIKEDVQLLWFPRQYSFWGRTKTAATPRLRFP